MNNLAHITPGRRKRRLEPIPRYVRSPDHLDQHNLGTGVPQPPRELPKRDRRKKKQAAKTFQEQLSKSIRVATATASEQSNSELEKLLADTYALQLKTQNFCWNANSASYDRIVPEMKKEEKELRSAVDKIARRIRRKGRRVPGTLTDLDNLTTITEQRRIPPAKTMLQLLKSGHKKIERQAAKVKRLARKANDLKTENLAADRIMRHRKMVYDIELLLE